MSTHTHSTNFLGAVAEIFGIVVMRFRPLPRIWALWLVATNAAAVVFIDRPEALVTLAIVGLAVFVQALIYQKLGFVRVLGIAHLMWIPMLLWFMTRLESAFASDPSFGWWLVSLISTNFISLLVDGMDVTRFLKGKKTPHYSWIRS